MRASQGLRRLNSRRGVPLCLVVVVVERKLFRETFGCFGTFCRHLRCLEMGICTSCCRPSDSTQNLVTPTADVRRQQVLEAAERRREEQESRGIKDVDKVRRAQQRKDEAERREEEAAKAGGQGPALKWQMN